jgi:hypothetical protein
MPRPCSVCENANREDIDNALVSGRSLRDIATQYPPLTISALSRHHSRHVSPALTGIEMPAGVYRRDPLPVRLERLWTQAETMFAAAAEAGQGAQALAILKEMRGQLELIGRLSGELDTRPVTVVNMLSSPEILAALNVVYSELADHPDLRQRIAARLQPERLALEAPR